MWSELDRSDQLLVSLGVSGGLLVLLVEAARLLLPWLMSMAEAMPMARAKLVETHRRIVQLEQQYGASAAVLDKVNSNRHRLKSAINRHQLSLRQHETDRVQFVHEVGVPGPGDQCFVARISNPDLAGRGLRDEPPSPIWSRPNSVIVWATTELGAKYALAARFPTESGYRVAGLQPLKQAEVA